MIRFAAEKDISAIRSIYSQYINTAFTFENMLPTEKEFAQRISYENRRILFISKRYSRLSNLFFPSMLE